MKEEPKIEILNEFLEEKINFHNDFVNEIEVGKKPNAEMLDALFGETIFEAWNRWKTDFTRNVIQKKFM